jgi:hypothetical protein
VPYKVIICIDILEELATSLFTVYLVKSGFMFLKGPFKNKCKIKELKTCAAIEI